MKIMKNKAMLKNTTFAVVILFIVIQFLPVGGDRDNPAVLAEPVWDSPETRATFFRSCADCHSNETEWPWYSYVAPVSWLVTSDVEEGRSEFNVSEWGRAEQHGDEAAEEVEEEKMPLPIYLPLHPEARLSESERAKFVEGLVATFGREED